MADSGIKAHPRSSSPPPPLLPSPSFPPSHRQLCLFLAAHVWQRHWIEKHIAPSITTHSSQQHTRIGGCLRPGPRSPSPLLKKNSRMTNIPLNRSRATSLSKCTPPTPPAPTLPATPRLALFWWYLTTESGGCAAFKHGLLLPCVMPIDQMKKIRGRRRRKMSLFINVWLMYSGISVFQVFCFGTGKDQSTQSTAIPALQPC